MRRIFKYTAILLVLELLFCIGIFAPAQAAAAITVSRTGYNTLAVNGTGFSTTAHTITVTYDATTVTATSDSSGNWNASITIPGAIAGSSHIITATDGTNSASTSYTMVAGIVLSRTSGTTGNSVTITGIGFAANSTVQVTFNNVSVGTGLTDASGSLNTTFTVPAAATGVYTVTATDASLNTASTNFTNTVTPTISLTPTSGTFGTSVTVTGSGFAANESNIQVTLNNTQVGSTTTASSSGAWSIVFTVPAMPGGSCIVGAFGSTTTAASVVTQAFTVKPAFTLGKASGVPGAAITANGSGFAANESNITLTWDGSSIGSPITADSKGSWTTSFNVPNYASGAHSIGAYGPTTAISSITAISFTIGANISISKASGTFGNSVTVTGSGFAANENGIVVTFDGATVGSSTNADATGSWSMTFTVPASFGGSHSVGAKGATTAATSVPAITFITLPTISSNKPGGAAGTSITISGSGFAANENNITVTYDDNPVSTGITADATGSWSATFTIPTSSAGTHTIKAKGSVTPLISAGNTNFKVASSISLIPPTGNISLSVNVTGSGFAGNSALSFYYDGNAIASVQAITDDSGNFTKSITIPKSIAGNHTIKVSDGSNNNSSATFIVENTPPPVPNPTLPADGSRKGLTGNITPDLKWSAVTDPSGVTYNLQVDTDYDFPHPIMEVTGLTNTHYTLTKAQALPKGQYYWRVKAIDNASNESVWSKSMMLHSGIISAGVLTFLIVLVIMIIVVALFVLFVRPAMKKRKAAAVPTAASAPEIIIPEMVNAEFRTSDAEDPSKRRALPWRLALPQATQPPKGARTFSPEEQARLKVVIDFARALPLMECGNNTDWLINLAENDGGNTASPTLYSQLLKGEIQVRYEPAWIRHPTFNDLQDLLEGQSVLQDLNSFIDAVNRTTSEAVQLLQNVYKDTTIEITGDILDNGGWGFISAVYNDSMSWFLGKYLREPSDRDYIIKRESETGEGINKFGLYGAQNTPFEGLLVQLPGEKEAAQMRILHLKLRRIYRNSDKSRQMASLLTQLDVQRNRLLNAFSQLGRLNP